jgi:hypothetical protein
MAETDWSPFVKPVPNKEYVALLTYLPIKSLTTVFYDSRRIQTQLKPARCLIGYSLLARLMAKRFWVLSVGGMTSCLRNSPTSNPSGSYTDHAPLHGGSDFIQWCVKKGSSVKK